MQLERSAPAALATHTTAHRDLTACVIAISLFAALSLYCGIYSEGFIAADACTHYLAARYAWQNPINFVDVWNRPLVTALYALPAWIGGREAVRIVCMLVAIGCGLVSHAIARGQGLNRPALALIFTLGQPLLFVHSFGEMTELPFALLLGLAFLAWQNERFLLAAILVGWTPLARPEGFGFVAIAAAGLILQRKWRQLIVLPIPIILWDLAGWIISHHAHPWWRWLPDSWPYSEKSLYGRGYLLTFVALLPAVVSPIVLPAVIVGIWLSIRRLISSILPRGRNVGVLLADADKRRSKPDVNCASREIAASAKGVSTNLASPCAGDAEGPTHQRLCIFLTAALPLFVLVVHSLLYWLGKMASFGEARYLLVVTPFWGVLAGRGWEWTWDRLRWRNELRWATGAVLLPVLINFAHPAVPIRLSHDWQSAREMAEWFKARPIATSHKAVIASHPGIFYFLGTNPHDSPSMGIESLRDAPRGTILIWDPIFSETNASAACTVSLDEIRRAGWKEIPSPDFYEPKVDSVHEAIRDSSDPRSHWHVFTTGD